ncbi:sensor histidine kinase [Tropicimonas sp. S265A]|uniref:sensor histidine kinase n=1 Tax=Tropicimonas sp. S265A TaxID=3415134 RepID=UPI003C7BEE33
MHDPALTGLLNMDAEPVRAFFRQAPVMMHAIDRSGALVAITNYWAARLGYLPEEMIGRASIEFLTPESRRIAVTDVLPRFFRDGEIQNQPYDFQRKDGSSMRVLLSAVTLRNEAGDFDRALAFVVEDDGRDLLQRDLQAALLKAERANRAKGQFLTAMSHELRSPMNAILGFAQLLKLTDLTRKQSTHVEAILASGRQLMVRLTDLLELSQLEFSDMQLSAVEIDADALLAPVIELWEVPIRAKGLGFTAVVDPELPVTITVDSGRLQQILNSFLSNALVYTEAGEVTLEVCLVRRVGQIACIECRVTDTGPGLDATEQAVIFQRFADKDEVPEKSGGGLGVGLSISRGIAEAMGAEIGVRSEKGRGATFFLRFDSPVSD